MKCPVGKNTKLMKCQVGKNAKLMNCQVDEMQVDEMLS